MTTDGHAPLWLVAAALVSVACGARPPKQQDAFELEEPPAIAPKLDLWAEPNVCTLRGRRHDTRTLPGAACGRGLLSPGEFGPPPKHGIGASGCPLRVAIDDGRVRAETFRVDVSFEPLPFDECVPPQYLLGWRRVIRVDDGLLVAYAGATDGLLSWTDESGAARQPLSTARVVGFAPVSGGVLALAIGKARLGRGGVLAIERGPSGYTTRLVATLPLEPAPAAFAEADAIVGFAAGFLFRVRATGQVENLHYVARHVGRVASIARDDGGAWYLGLDCGVMRLAPDGATFREEWWSVTGGASGRWEACNGHD